MKKTDLTILFCSNRWAFPGLVIALFSCLKNISITPHFFVLHQELIEADFELIKNNLNSLDKEYTITFEALDESLFQGLRAGPNNSMLTYARLWADIYFKDQQWLVYLDCDMLINIDLAKLFLKSELLGELAAVVDESSSDFKNSRDIKACQQKFTANHPYFNAGFLCINMGQFRQFKLFEAARKILFENPQGFIYHDQTVLNVLFAGKWQALERRWNDQHRLDRSFSPSYSSYLNSIIHTPGAVKLWMVASVNAQGIVKLFYDYFNQLVCPPDLGEQKICYLPYPDNPRIIKVKTMLRKNPTPLFRGYRRFRAWLRRE